MVIDCRNNTKAAMTYLQSTDVWAEEIFKDTEYAMELDRRNVILEGVQDRLEVMGIHYKPKQN